MSKAKGVHDIAAVTMTAGAGGGAFQNTAARFDSPHPTAYRMVRRGQEYVLQGIFVWQQGISGGAEWRDIPTVVEQEGV